MAWKLYKGDPKDDSLENVKVVDGHNGTVVALPLRTDLRNHSPTGFAWGYGGSGPHQLALALLADATGDDNKAKAYYHSYVWQIISALDGDSEFTILQADVLTWLQNEEKKRAEE